MHAITDGAARVVLSSAPCSPRHSLRSRSTRS